MKEEIIVQSVQKENFIPSLSLWFKRITRNKQLQRYNIYQEHEIVVWQVAKLKLIY